MDAGEQQLRLCTADAGDRRLAIGGAVRDGREQFDDAVRVGVAGDVTQVPVGVVTAEEEVREQRLQAGCLAGDGEVAQHTDRAGDPTPASTAARPCD